MQSPREISSARQGALTPTTAALVAKAAAAADVPGATPRALDPSAGAWANLTVDTAAGDGRDGRDAGADAGTAALRSGPGRAADARAATGALPARYTADLRHWQSPADLPERRLMVQRIMAMTRGRRLGGGALAAAGRSAGCAEAARSPSLAKRIELSLYSRAASFGEYRDLNTLRRRLQSLVALSYHEAAGARRLASEASAPDSGSDSVSVSVSAQIRASACDARGKRCRAAAAAATATAAADGSSMRRPKRKRARTERSPAPARGQKLFFLTSADALRAVFAFLGGVETARLTAVNRFAARALPLCVTALRVDVDALRRADASLALLARFPNLEELTLTRVRGHGPQPSNAQPQPQPQPYPQLHRDDRHPPVNQDENQDRGPGETREPQGKPDTTLHAWDCPELELAHDNAGERAVAQLGEALERGAGRRLRALRLVAVFSHTCRVNALHGVCAALVKGACPDLEELLLGGNALADVGAVDVAWLLRAGSLPKLARLDLRRNYIGESGLRRLMDALAAGRSARLQFLCLGGNIITDACVAPVVQLLALARCPRLRFLGLEDNFLSASGVRAVIRAAEAGGMMPKLHHVAARDV